MQIYKVILSDLAQSDLQNIVSYIAENESITMAKYVERGILSKMKQLKIFPAAYPKDEYASSDEIAVRFVIKWRYKILFFIDDNAATVQITGIFHTAQNPDKLSSHK